MVGIILPPDLTPEQQAGFRYACATMATWGRQIANEGAKLGLPKGPLDVGPMEHAGRMLVHVADALDRTIGRGRTLRADDLQPQLPCAGTSATTR